MVGTAYSEKVLAVNKQDGEENVVEALKSIFTELMSASKDMISKALSKLKNRLNVASEVNGTLFLILLTFLIYYCCGYIMLGVMYVAPLSNGSLSPFGI